MCAASAHPGESATDSWRLSMRRGRAEISTTDSINFVLDGGKLVKLTMLVDKPLDEASSDLTQKFGPADQSHLLPRKTAPARNGATVLHIWDMPTVYITLYQDNNPSLQDHRVPADRRNRTPNMFSRPGFLETADFAGKHNVDPKGTEMRCAPAGGGSAGQL